MQISDAEMKEYLEYATETLTYLPYYYRHQSPPNPHLLSLYRLSALSDSPHRPPADSLLLSFAQDGLFTLASELQAVTSNAIILFNIFSQRPSIRQDERELKQIRAQKEYYREEELRRREMSIQIASSFKQTLQVNYVKVLERGVDVIHRSIIEGVGLASEES